MKLMPVNYGESYDWSGHQKYALVGASSGFIHAVFDVNSLEAAIEIQDFYTKIRGDAGYELMMVDMATLQS